MNGSKGKKYFSYMWLFALILNISLMQISFAAGNQAKMNQNEINPVDEFNLNSLNFPSILPEPGEWTILSQPQNANAKLEKINATEAHVKFVNQTTGNYRFQFQSASNKIDSVEIFYGLKTKFSTDEAFFTSPAVYKDGTFYLSSENYPGMGSIWHFSADGASHSLVSTTDGRYYLRGFVDAPILTPQGKLFGVMDNNPDDPGYNVYWRTIEYEKVEFCKAYLSYCYYSVPALRDDGIFYGVVFGKHHWRDKGIGVLLASNTEIVSTQPDTTTYDWLISLDFHGFELHNTVISADGTIYTSTRSFLYAVNSDSTLKWKYPLTSEITTVPAVDVDGTIYFGAADQQMYAIANDGSLKWTFPAENKILSSPAIDVDGTIYFGSSDWNFYALNPDGEVKWKTLTSGPILSSPAIAQDGSIYVGSDDRRLYAFSAAGEVLWYFETEFPLRTSPAIADDGTLIFCDGNMNKIFTGSNYYTYEANGNVYQIATQNGGLAQSSWPKYRHDNRNTSCAMNKITAVQRHQEEMGNPTDVKLFSNFPNPFNSSTTIRFQIPTQQQSNAVKLVIYDVLGQEVRRFDLAEWNSSLKNEIKWYGKDSTNQFVASGTYLAVLTNGSWRKTVKLLYLK